MKAMPMWKSEIKTNIKSGTTVMFTYQIIIGVEVSGWDVRGRSTELSSLPKVRRVGGKIQIKKALRGSYNHFQSHWTTIESTVEKAIESENRKLKLKTIYTELFSKVSDEKEPW